MSFPASDIDDPRRLLEALGSFWSDTYGGQDVVLGVLDARLAGQRQAFQNGRELIDACSRFNVPVYHEELNHPIRLLESGRNGADYAVRKYDEAGLVYAASTSERYGAAVARPLTAWRLPDGVAALPLLSNRITTPSLTLAEGVDYVLQDGFVVFRDDPFLNDLVPKTSLMQDNVEVDREVVLWATRAKLDRRIVYRQFGYVLGVEPADAGGGPAYKDLVNALFDALVLGSTGDSMRAAWSALTGVPLAQGDETVETVLVDPADGRNLVITDKAVYAFSAQANVLVEAGDRLGLGQSLTDALTFYEFNRGQVPPDDEIRALALGRGMLAAGFFGDLVFENKDVDLVVESDDDGYTKLSWHLGGWPGDVTAFFDTLHAKGRAAGQTLANLLDRRPAAARDTEPTAGSLPTTINPFAFLCENVLRNNVIVVRVRPAAFGPERVGLHAAGVLRRVVQPHTVMLVVAALEYEDAPITMDGPGDEQTPGYEEDVSVYLGLTAEDTLDPAELITEEVRCYQIGGHCT